MDISAELRIIDRAVEAHQIKEVWALFSGGHDSLISTHIASQHPLFKGVLHINTGIGIKDTRKFVIETCKRYRWALQIYSAKFSCKADGTPMTYRDLVLKYGFPGGAQHSMMYTWLKERQIDRFIRDRKTGDRKFRIGLVSGVRTHESRKRTLNMKNLVDGCMRDGSRVWISPIGDWADCKCEKLIKSVNLPRNPVKDNICKSGECLCVAGDTLISTPEGWRQIADLNIGDLVYGSVNEQVVPQPIHEIHCNEPKPMISIKPYFLPAVEMTRNHPLYVKPYKHKMTRIDKKKTSRQEIEKATYLESGEVERHFLEGRQQTAWKQQKFYIGYPFRTDEIALNLNDAQLKLIGYFIAEGAYNWRKDKYRNSKGGIVFTVSHKSLAMAEDIKYCIESGLGLSAHRRDWTDERTGRKFITIRNCSKQSSDFISCFVDGRYCWEKSLNQSLMLASLEQQERILNAMWLGDGSEYDFQREGGIEKASVYTTTSKILALQTHEILLRLGKIYGIRTSKPSNNPTKSIVPRLRTTYQVAKSNNSTRCGFIEDGWLWTAIQSITGTTVQQAWNLTIAGEPNYLTHGGLVHNCGAFSQRNELTELGVFYPDVAAEIKALEAEVKANGFPWGWEEKPPTWWGKKKQHEKLEEQGQLNLFSFAPLEACDGIAGSESFLPLCSSCQQLRQD